MGFFCLDGLSYLRLGSAHLHEEEEHMMLQ